MANGLVNGYPHWLKLDGSQAIWFDKVGSSWLVSTKDNLGTNTGGITGPDGKDSYPNEIKQGWRFTIAVEEPWADATPSEIIYKAIGMYNLQTFTSQNQFNLFPFANQHLSIFNNCLSNKKFSNHLFKVLKR